MKIAVVDDDDGVRRAIENYLQFEGHDVRTFPDGHPFLVSDCPEWLDLLLTDISMPTTGEIVIRTVRRNRPDAAIVAMTGSYQHEKLMYLLVLGADAVLRKPLNFDTLNKDLLDFHRKRASHD